MRMGQVGPRTVLKWRIKGIKLLRNRVSMMTATLELRDALKITPEAFAGFQDGFLGSSDVVLEFEEDVQGLWLEYMLSTECWGNVNLTVQMKNRTPMAIKKIFLAFLLRWSSPPCKESNMSSSFQNHARLRATFNTNMSREGMYYTTVKSSTQDFSVKIQRCSIITKLNQQDIGIEKAEKREMRK